MLTLLNTKPNLLPGAVLYFKIYALGMPALGIFNFGSAVMSANGDTRRPLIYLTVAGVLNVILNLFFVIVCHMAAEGVAISSVISQYLSAALILVHMFREKDDCGLRLSNLRLYEFRSPPCSVWGFLRAFKVPFFPLPICSFRLVSIV